MYTKSYVTVDDLLMCSTCLFISAEALPSTPMPEKAALALCPMSKSGCFYPRFYTHDVSMSCRAFMSLSSMVTRATREPPLMKPVGYD